MNFPKDLRLTKVIWIVYGWPGVNPWVGKIRWRRERLPTSVFWLGEFHELYSPWGHKESDTTEGLSHTHKDNQQEPELTTLLFVFAVQLLSCIPLLRDPMGCSPPGPSVFGIFQARILDRVAISFSRGSSQPGNRTQVACIGRWILYHWATWETRHSLSTY